MNITERFLSFSLLGAEWVMWLLRLLSVISMGLMIERGVFFWRNIMKLELVLPDFRKLLNSGDYLGAKKKLEDGENVDALAVAAAFDCIEKGPSAVEEAIDEGVALLRPRLDSRLAFLGTVGNNAPFVGLFGTVLGIIQAFHDLSMNTQGGAGTVMAGISEALVATAIGLLVAIPAVAAFNYFQRRVKSSIGNVDVLRHALLSALKGEESISSKEPSADKEEN